MLRTSGLPVAKQGHGAETRIKDPRVSGRNHSLEHKTGALPDQFGDGNHLMSVPGLSWV